jgi:uncharacterized protein (DUF433 family)
MTAILNQGVKMMTATPSLSRVKVDPDVCGGVPTVGSEQRPVAHILERLAEGASADQIVDENPDLSLSDIELALKTAAWVMRDPLINWAELDLSGMVEFQSEMQLWQGMSSDLLDDEDSESGD